MKWLKSTTDKSYTAQGKIIPPSESAPLAVSDTVFESITSMKVIASLIKTGGIIVLDKYNDPQVDNKEQLKLQQLHVENARLAGEKSQLEAEVARLKEAQPSDEVVQKAAQFDELKTEAEQTISAKDAEIERLKAELAKAKKSAKKDSE